MHSDQSILKELMLLCPGPHTLKKKECFFFSLHIFYLSRHSQVNLSGNGRLDSFCWFINFTKPLLLRSRNMRRFKMCCHAQYYDLFSVYLPKTCMLWTFFQRPGVQNNLHFHIPEAVKRTWSGLCRWILTKQCQPCLSLEPSLFKKSLHLVLQGVKLTTILVLD